MAATFTYDLISFLRVLYRRRYFILIGSFLVTVLVALVSLIWPETWRAEARVLVSTPKFKETLQLIPEPFDVLTYQGIMTSDELYQQVIDSLVWFNRSIHILLTPASQEALQAALQQKAEGKSPIQRVALADGAILSSLLKEPNPSPVFPKLVALLTFYTPIELQTLADLNPDALEELSVFDLRKSLQTSVSVVRETNVETVYSNLIDVAAQFDTAVGSKLLANLWVDLFIDHAEEITRSTVLKPVRQIRHTVTDLEGKLQAAERKLADSKSKYPVERIRAEMASKMVALTGVTPSRNQLTQSTEDFDTTNRNKPFLTQTRESLDIFSYEVTPQYPEALIPLKYQLERELAAMATVPSATKPDADSKKRDAETQRIRFQHTTLTGQISALTQEVNQTWLDLQQHENEAALLDRSVVRLRDSLDSLTPLLAEAELVEQNESDFRYADVQPSYAITPEKRISPKRSYMTLAGAVLSFFLFCGLTFFLDIWSEVVRPDEETTV